MATHYMVNGVDVDRLNETIEKLRENPELARFEFRARHQWIDGAHARTEIQDFYGAGQEDTSRSEPFVLEADEPPVLLGTNEGANATEAALHALASCLSSTFIYHAAARGVPVDGLELELEGDLDIRGFLGLSHEVRRGFDEIRVTFHVQSDAPREEIEELTDLAQRRSPVFDIVTNPTPVQVVLDME